MQSAILSANLFLIIISWVGTIIIFILNLRKLRHREAEELTQGHTARRWQAGLGLGALIPGTLPSVLCCVSPLTGFLQLETFSLKMFFDGSYGSYFLKNVHL